MFMFFLDPVFAESLRNDKIVNVPHIWYHNAFDSLFDRITIPSSPTIFESLKLFFPVPHPLSMIFETFLMSTF